MMMMKVSKMHLAKWNDCILFRIIELADIKEVLSPTAEGSMIIERAISMRTSLSETR